NRGITDRAIFNSNVNLRKFEHYFKNKCLYSIPKEELKNFFCNEREVSNKSYSTYGGQIRYIM
ncbi:hypothetical protein ACFL1L_01845, partial [Thermoplasmatota archaeon]